MSKNLYTITLNWHGEVLRYNRWACSDEQAMHYATRELARVLKKSVNHVRPYFADNKDNHKVEVINLEYVRRLKEEEVNNNAG